MNTGYQDPRGASDFISKFYPTANGIAPPPTDSASRDAVIILEFLAAYYRLNREYARLLEARQSLPSPQRDRKEHEHLQAVERALVARDRLEDIYAAYGVIAEPMVRDGFTCDVRFAFGQAFPGKQSRAEAILFEAVLPITSALESNLDTVPVRVHVVQEHAGPTGPLRRFATSIAGFSPPEGSPPAPTETGQP